MVIRDLIPGDVHLSRLEAAVLDLPEQFAGEFFGCRSEFRAAS